LSSAKNDMSVASPTDVGQIMTEPGRLSIFVQRM
jgi:hypothetical protein